MALKYYDNKVLNFLYELTKLNKFMSYEEISKQINLDSGIISPKTVERWFNFLRKPYLYKQNPNYDKADSFPTFNYFPTFFYEKLGLVPAYVILEEPSKQLLESFPSQKYNDYAVWLFDTSLKKSVLLYGFAVPIEHLEFFKKEWGWIKERNGVKNYKIYITNKAFNIFSPWHKTIDDSGIFHPELNDKKEIDNQVNNFSSYLDNLPEFNMVPKIKKNPLVIPAIFEQHRSGWSSSKVWDKIENKLGMRAWDYVIRKKKRNRDIGIKRVQEAMKDISNFDILHQMKVAYMPLELKHNFILYSILKYKNKDELLKSLKDISMNSLYLSVRPLGDNRVFIILLINNKSLTNIFTPLEKIKVERMLFVQHEKSLSLLANKNTCKFNYRDSFDIKRFKWKK